MRSFGSGPCHAVQTEQSTYADGPSEVITFLSRSPIGQPPPGIKALPPSAGVFQAQAPLSNPLLPTSRSVLGHAIPRRPH